LSAIRAVRNVRKTIPEEITDVQGRAVAGPGTFSGSTIEYLEKESLKPILGIGGCYETQLLSP
jgi:hypothetical protein